MRPVIAKYLRISDEDIDLDGIEKHESNSIGNQRSLLGDFIANSPEFAGFDIVEYLDDGRTGTNFSRSGVQELLKAAQMGNVQCIIVKDISRLGRSYLEVGDLLEQKFPAWGVRFISLGDMYDSAELIGGATGGINMAFRGLIAQMYSQDLSEKIRSSKDAASRSGKIVTSQPTYGYDVDKDDRHKFAVNPSEADVIKRIYDLYEQGVRVSEIVRILNAESVTTPQESKRLKGYRANWGRGDLWGKGAVSSILRNERYTGKWIYGKARVSEMGSKRAYPVPKGEWIVVDGAIPKIIEQDQFDRVQELISKSSKNIAAPQPEKALFARKIKCGKCGMGMANSVLKAGRVYRCSMKRQSAKFDCQTERINECEIYDAVLSTIQLHVLLAEEKVAHRHERTKIDRAQKDVVRSKIRMLKLNIEKSNVEKVALWEEFHNRVISRDVFQSKSRNLSERGLRYESSISLLEAEVLELENRLPNETDSLAIERYNKLGGITELTKELVGELVQEIHVYSSEQIEIVWRYGNLFAR